MTFETILGSVVFAVIAAILTLQAFAWAVK